MSKHDLGTLVAIDSGSPARRRRSRTKLLAATLGIVLVVAPSFFGATASSRPPRNPTRGDEVAKQGRAGGGARGGASGDVLPDDQARRALFSVRGQGVETRPVQAAALRFLATLPPGQEVPFPGGAGDWLDRMDRQADSRPGVPLGAWPPARREAAIALIESSMGAAGLGGEEGIVNLRVALGELAAADGIDRLAVLGRPGPDRPWGWQLEGPRLVVNYFVLGDRVVVTPTRLAAGPADHLAAVARP